MRYGLVILILMTVFVVLYSGSELLRQFTGFVWLQTGRQMAASPLTRPGQTTWAVSPPVRRYRPHHRRHLLVLLSTKADAYLAVSRRAE